MLPLDPRTTLALLFLLVPPGPTGANSPESPEGPPATTQSSRRRDSLPSKVKRAVDAGLDWLVEHQSEDGAWSAAGFDARCSGKDHCVGRGDPRNDVGVTGLAVLALLGKGDRGADAAHEAAIAKGLEYLGRSQAKEGDPNPAGLFGQESGHSFLYNHAVATLAVAAARRDAPSDELDASLAAAVSLIRSARNPGGAWRYDLPPSGDNDTSMTSWMTAALVEAAHSGHALDSETRRDVLAWLDEATDPETGRIGYDAKGSPSARIHQVNDQYPVDATECMTAAGFACRLALGQDPESEEILGAHSALLLKALPFHSDDGMSNDVYYWMKGTEAMYGMQATAKRDWKAWESALHRALLGSQEKRGHGKGSWAPDGPWGFSGGRVYSTSMAVLALTTPLRIEAE